MSAQEQLDKLENMVLSTGGFVKVYNMLNFAGKSLELKQIEDDLGAMIEQVLDLKKELGCTSNLTLTTEPDDRPRYPIPIEIDPTLPETAIRVENPDGSTVILEN